MKLIRQIAIRHLKAPQKGSFTTFAAILAIIGLGIGIAALILTFSILKGFETTISEKIAQFDGHLRVEHFMNKTLMVNNNHFESAIDSSPVNCDVITFIQSPTLLRKGSEAEGVITIGIDNINENMISSIAVEGSTEIGSNGIMIGKRLAENLDIEIGDKVVLFDLQTIGRISSGQRFKQFKITGLFHSGLLEYDKTVVYINIQAAQYIFNAKDKVSGYMLFVDNTGNVDVLKDYLDQELGYPFYSMTWKDKHKILFDWINIQKWPILIIFGMIAFVGLVNIISSLSMIIFEKVREIGTLLSLGLSKKNIRRIFLLEGLIIGLAGSLVGVGIAFGIAFLQTHFQIFSIPEDIYFMDHIPIQFRWLSTVIIVGIGTVSAVLASLWPVYKSNQIHPAEALRYE